MSWALLLVAACVSGSSTPAHIVVVGSTTIQPVAATLGRAFERSHPGTKVEVRAGGSDIGVAAARAGLADVGAVGRPLRAEEQDLRADRIGSDGLVLVVNSSNPVVELTSAQVNDIYAGRVRSWAALGWVDHPIVPVAKLSGTFARTLFDATFGLTEGATALPTEIGPNADAIAMVAANPYAVAYVGLGAAETERAHDTAIRLVGLDGLTPTVDTVADGSWPLQRPLNLVTRDDTASAAHEFVAFALSPEGQALVEDQALVPAASGEGDHERPVAP